MPKDQQEKSQKEIKKVWKVFLIEAFLFSLTLGLGILAALRINKFMKIRKIALPQISFWDFIISFLLVTLFILFLIHFLKRKRGRGLIFKFIFTLAVFLGGILFLEAFFLEPIPLILISLLVIWWWKQPSILNQDILMILGLAGVGSTLGLSLQPLMVVLLLIIFSIYDFIAVYKTKHMVKMAKEMIESRAVLALMVPPNLSGFKESLIKVQPGGKFLVLGGGDIVFPLLFSVSLIPFGILKVLIVAFFSLIGLLVSFYIFISQETRQPIPALPPIALFSIIGFLITYFL